MRGTFSEIREQRGGFTLAELLIVVAIILVLVAIAIPVFTGALGQAQQAADDANIRSVRVTAANQILMSGAEYANDDIWMATATVSSNGNMGKVTVTDSDAAAAAAGDTVGEPNDDGERLVTVFVTPTEVDMSGTTLSSDG